MEIDCKNCGNKFTGKYCNNCGQKSEAPPFTFKYIFVEAFYGFTSADKSFLLYAKRLLANPGKLAYEYIIAGKRKKYFNPFTFFVLSTSLFTLIEGLDLTQKEELFNYGNTYGKVFNIYSKAFSVGTIPLIAVAIWLIHRQKQRARYSEYTVFAMILFSLYSTIGIFYSAINYVLTFTTQRYISIEDHLLFAGFITVYMAYASLVFHKKLNNSTILKSILSGVSFCVMLQVVQMAIIFAILNHFRGLGVLYIYGIHVSSP